MPLRSITKAVSEPNVRKKSLFKSFLTQNGIESKHNLTGAEPKRGVVVKVGTLQSRRESTILDSDRTTCAVSIARNLEEY